MASEKKHLLQLLFGGSSPADWEIDVTVDEFLKKIGTYKIDDLIKEPVRLQAEDIALFEQTQELAVSNYRTFINTADCSKELFVQFSSIETKLDDLLENHISEFEKKSEEFAEKSSSVNNLRKLNSLALTKNAQLLEILELPQLMNSFINDGLYEDALELAIYVRKTYSKHPDIPIFKNIVEDVEKSWLLMLHRLLSQLRNDISLPKCIQIVGHIRRMEILTESELRLKFLQARRVWLKQCLKGIRRDDVNHHLTKVIEVTRVNVFNIITQYEAIFNDDEHSPLSVINSTHVNQNAIFYSWIQNCIKDFLVTLEEDLNQGVSSLDSILGQCMYFGCSFSKVGCDFRTSLIPIFVNAICRKFRQSIELAIQDFHRNIDRFTLINKNHAGVPWKSKSSDPLQPPDSLLEFYPLAEYLNNVLAAFNELRLCPSIAIIDDVVTCLEDSLLAISKSIFVLYGQEQQAFTASSKDAFTRLCMIFADDLIPYIQKCLHVIYPLGILSSYLGIGANAIQNEGISFLSRSRIVEPIKDLLPAKITDDKHMPSANLELTIATSDVNSGDVGTNSVDHPATICDESNSTT